MSNSSASKVTEETGDSSEDFREDDSLPCFDFVSSFAIKSSNCTFKYSFKLLDGRVRLTIGDLVYTINDSTKNDQHIKGGRGKGK